MKILAVLTLVWLQLGLCVDYQTTKSLMEDFYSTIEQPVNRLQNLFRANFAPTLWCGIRNSAPFPDALSAIYPHLDSCCRIHDLCPLYINRGECFEGVCNPSFLTPILSCDCEQEFRECLKSLPSAKTLPEFPITWMERLLTDLTGFGYFGILPFILEHKCLMRIPARPKCIQWNYKDHQCREFSKDNIISNGTWDLISLHRDFNHRDWFRSSNYINDVINTSELEEFFQRLMSEKPGKSTVSHDEW